MGIERNEIVKVIQQIKAMYPTDELGHGELHHLVSETLSDNHGVPFVPVEGAEEFTQPEYQHPNYAQIRNALIDNSDLFK